VIKNVFLAGGSYTAMGAFNGYYSDFSAAKLGSAAIKAAIERAKVSPKDVDEVYMGNCIAANLGQNVARQAALGAGLPPACGAVTMNKMCGSGLRAITAAAQAIQCGDAELIVAGGTENMTQAPYLMPKGRSGYGFGHGQVLDSMMRDGLEDAYTGKAMGVFAEQCVKKYGFTREEQDKFAIESFKRAIAAHTAGYLKEVLVPVEITTKKGSTVYDRDEGPSKFDETKYPKLRPAFDPNGTVTAGNASQISDGAAAAVVVSEARAKALNIPLQAKILGYCTASLEPEWFTVAPVHAMKKLSEKLSLKLADVDLFEVNEAFACVTMAAMKDLSLPHDKVNVFGGAIAMGHPIGASGARVVATLIAGLKAKQKKLGVAALCIGGGEAIAIAIERVG